MDLILASSQTRAAIWADAATRLNKGTVVTQFPPPLGVQPAYVVLSTGGAPWVLAELDPKDFNCSFEIAARSTPTMEKIKKAAKAARRVYLTFEDDRDGEGNAAQFRSWLESNGFDSRNIARVRTNSLRPQDIAEVLQSPDLGGENGRLREGRVHAALNQKVIDILHARELKDTLEKSNLPPKGTRYQCALLELIARRQGTDNPGQTNKSKLTPSHYEIEVDLGYGRGKVILPDEALTTWFKSQGSVEVDKIAEELRRFWEHRLESERRDHLDVSPNRPGESLKFWSRTEAENKKDWIHGQHFLRLNNKVEQHTIEPQPPLNLEELVPLLPAISIIDYKRYLNGLDFLYESGWITSPHNAGCNFTIDTYHKIISYCRDKQIEMSPHGKREWHEEHPGRTEALHPTNFWIEKLSAEEIRAKRKSKTSVGDLDEEQLNYIYQLIHTRALASHARPQLELRQTVHLFGPIEELKRMVKKPNSPPSGSWVNVERLHVLKVSSQVVPGAPEPPMHMNAQIVKIIEKYWAPHRRGTREEILLQARTIARPKTLINSLQNLLELGWIAEEQNERQSYLRVTPQGYKVLKAIRPKFSAFLEPNYHRTIEYQLEEIAQGRIDHKAFLNQWYMDMLKVSRRRPIAINQASEDDEAENEEAEDTDRGTGMVSLNSPKEMAMAI